MDINVESGKNLQLKKILTPSISIRLLSTTAQESIFLNSAIAEQSITTLWQSPITYANHILIHFEYQIHTLKYKNIKQITHITRILKKNNSNQQKINRYKCILERYIKRNWNLLINKIETYNKYVETNYKSY